MMNEMGYSNVNVETCLTNGLSHYVRLNVEVLNEGKCFANMFIYNGKTEITIRISDHASGLEKIVQAFPETKCHLVLLNN